MVTAVYSLGRVQGADAWLLFCLLCLAGYLALCAAPKVNRAKGGYRRVLLGLLLVEIMADLIWARIYYPGGEYINYGVGAVFGLGLWPVLLLLMGLIITDRNRQKTNTAAGQ